MIIQPTRNVATTSANHDALTVTVPRQSTYRIPAGCYHAVIVKTRPEQRQSRQGSVHLVRIYFAVTVPGMPHVDHLAKLEVKLSMNEGGDLSNLLSRLLGDRRWQELSGQPFSLQSIVGTECDVELGHVHDEHGEYDYPLVIVTDIQPRGTLVVDQN